MYSSAAAAYLLLRVYEKDVEQSVVDFNLRDGQTEEVIAEGSNLELDHEYWIEPTSHGMYNFYVGSVYVGQDESVFFHLNEQMVDDKKVIIKVVNE